MTTSFYVEPPTIPEGMTIAEYRRARRSHRQRLGARLVGRCRQVLTFALAALALAQYASFGAIGVDGAVRSEPLPAGKASSE